MTEEYEDVLDRVFEAVDVSSVENHPERTKVTFWTDGPTGGDPEEATYLSTETLLQVAAEQTDNKYVQVNISRAMELLEGET
jgi:hypothetical protein